MDIQERTGTYIRSLEPDLPEYLQTIEDNALESFVPIIRGESQSVLRTLITLRRPARILEIGMAVGFSALLMRDSLIRLGLDSDITTIEYFEPRFPVAKANFEQARVRRTGFADINENRKLDWQFNELKTVTEVQSTDEISETTESVDVIRMIRGDALRVLPLLEGTYDMIFLDAAKAQYINMLPEIKRLMPVGGLLVTDNILQEGDILESRYLICQRDRTIHARMREFLYAIKHDPELESTILPVGDGMYLSVKKQV